MFALVRSAFHRRIFVTCTTLAAANSACTGSSPSGTTAELQTPTQVAVAWFAAMNANDLRLANSYLAGRPGYEPPSPKFHNVHCQPERTRSEAAQVLCTFHIERGLLLLSRVGCETPSVILITGTSRGAEAPPLHRITSRARSGAVSRKRRR